MQHDTAETKKESKLPVGYQTEKGISSFLHVRQNSHKHSIKKVSPEKKKRSSTKENQEEQIINIDLKRHSICHE
jgi:hypothetical protein